MAKKAFTCMLAPGTIETIQKQAVSDGCSQADVVHRAIALLCFGDEVSALTAPRMVSAAQVETIARNVTPHPPRSTRTCEHGKAAGYHCTLCRGIAKV